ncbi:MULTISPECIES: NUDIX domain-containing protein [Corynebacterium]|uniref:NUDIX domain-containing protein n=1 Tax=Corynebacterium TaxID=1716 RepID=UPI00124D00FD|nr:MULTISPECIES: NUDIX hydrolase [Corynebacterium]
MSHEFTVEDSEILNESPILALRRDTVTMPGGSSAKREIIEHFGAVAVVAQRDSGEIAMVRQYRHSVQQRLWELPAGLLDVAEEPALRCAQRELQEEAGLSATRWHVLCDVVSSPGFCEEAIRIFLARDLTEVPRPEAVDEEADMTLEWVPLEKAAAAVLRGEIVNSIAISGIMAAYYAAEHEGVLRSVDTPFELRPTRLAARRAALWGDGDLKRV